MDSSLSAISFIGKRGKMCTDIQGGGDGGSLGGLGPPVWEASRWGRQCLVVFPDNLNH